MVDLGEHPAVRPAIAGALTAYACGDALGVPWEGKPPGSADRERAVEIPSSRDWPRGSTSDDTALTLLVAEHLLAHGGPGDPAELMRTLAARAGSVPGLGPSTRAAIARFRDRGELPAEGGRTNGAVMRALPAGWATPARAAQTRRRWVIALSSATHHSPDAQAAACVAATCASWAVEGAGGLDLIAAARAEAKAVRTVLDVGIELEELVDAVGTGAWTPPAAGISLDPLETLAAVLHCVADGRPSSGRTTDSRPGDSRPGDSRPTDSGPADGRPGSGRPESRRPGSGGPGDDGPGGARRGGGSEPEYVESALLRAVGLGGDTDTVAALVAGIIGCRFTPDRIRSALPWSERVLLPPAATLDAVADGLASLRETATV